MAYDILVDQIHEKYIKTTENNNNVAAVRKKKEKKNNFHHQHQQTKICILFLFLKIIINARNCTYANDSKLIKKGKKNKNKSLYSVV